MPPPTGRRPLRQEPGLLALAVVVAYSVFVWTWWPADVLLGRVSLVVPLMAVGVALWVALSFAFVLRVEQLEAGESER
jgi:hypothetical protein